MSEEAGSDPGTGATRGLIYRSAALALALQWAIRVIGIISVVTLARLLRPEDFGVVAVALTASALVEVLGWIGLGQALLRVRNPERAHYDTAFTLQFMIFGTLAAIQLAIVAPLAASFNEIPVLEPVLAVLSIRLLCIALSNVGVTDFERYYQFDKDLKMRVGGRLAALFVTLAAALILRNYWALVTGMVAQTMISTISSYIAHPYRPRLSLAKRKELLGVSIWIFVSTLAAWLQREIERLVLARVATTHVVGLYSTSKELAMIFTQEISTALNRVSFVTIAGAERPMRENAGVAMTMGAYAMIAAPMAFGLAAVAPNAIQVLLGDQWIAATSYLRLVAIYTGLQAIYHVVISVLQAGGQEKRAAWLNIAAAILIGGAVIGAGVGYRSALLVGYAALVASFLITLLCMNALAVALGVRVWKVAAHIVRPVLAAGMMAAVVIYIPPTGLPFLDLVAGVALGAPVYVAALIAIWFLWRRPGGPESEALGIVRSLIAKRGAVPRPQD